MLGEKGYELVKEAGRAREQLVPFNEEVVRQCLEETRQLWEENRREVAETETISASTALRHAAVERNKRCVLSAHTCDSDNSTVGDRCLLAYLSSRAERVQELRWQFGAVLPSEVRHNLAEPELELFTKYSRNLAGYMRSVGADLTADLTPPKSLYIEV